MPGVRTPRRPRHSRRRLLRRWRRVAEDERESESTDDGNEAGSAECQSDVAHGWFPLGNLERILPCFSVGSGPRYTGVRPVAVNTPTAPQACGTSTIP